MKAENSSSVWEAGRYYETIGQTFGLLVAKRVVQLPSEYRKSRTVYFGRFGPIQNE
jgi:hypothetical protein